MWSLINGIYARKKMQLDGIATFLFFLEGKKNWMTLGDSRYYRCATFWSVCLSKVAHLLQKFITFEQLISDVSNVIKFMMELTIQNFESVEKLWKTQQKARQNPKTELDKIEIFFF